MNENGKIIIENSFESMVTKKTPIKESKVQQLLG